MRTPRVTAILAGLVTVLLLGGGVEENRAQAADAPKYKVYEKWPFDENDAQQRQKETAEALGIPVEKSIDLGGGVKLELVLVPAGEFMMGGDEPLDEVARKYGEITRLVFKRREHPQHKVRITQPFYLGKYEVTQEQWERLMGKNPSRFKGAKLPVEMVSWDDCSEFVKKLNGLGKEKDSFRLPTEAEWEYACRAGTATAFQTGGTISTDQANYDGNYTYGDGKKGEHRKKTTEVGAFAANAFGLYDMHGNVSEWCADWHNDAYYAESPKDDPTGPGRGQSRVVRGGSWDYPPLSCRSANRAKGQPNLSGSDTGLRVVLRDP